MSAADLARLGKAARAKVGARNAAATADGAPPKVARSRKPGGCGKGDAEVASPRRGTGRLVRREWEGAEVTIEIDLPPRPKERARTFADTGALIRAFASAKGDARRFMASVKGKSSGGEGGIMRSVTPEATRRYEEAVGLVSTRAMARAGLEPFSCPLEAVVEFRFEGDPTTWPTAEGDGDLDNLAKAIFDGMNARTYLDDRLLVRKALEKRCAARAGITVRIRPARPGASAWEEAEGQAILVWRTGDGAVLSAPMAAGEASAIARGLEALARLPRGGFVGTAPAADGPDGPPLLVLEGGPG